MGQIEDLRLYAVVVDEGSVRRIAAALKSIYTSPFIGVSSSGKKFLLSN